MIGLLEMLVTAALVSGAAVLCLRLLPHAPPRLRFRIALGALASWAVPWPMLSVPLELPAPSVLVEWRDAAPSAVPWPVAAAEEVSVSVPAASTSARYESAGWWSGADEAASAWQAPRAEAAASDIVRGLQRIPVGYLVTLLFLPGLLRLVSDAVALRASLAAWRSSSRSGQALRGALPPELQYVRASIRVVPDSAIAATSGWLRPVVWLGERLCERDRQVALVHELCHVERRDPLWITFVTAMRRAYWWNPAVAWLCREAVLAMEADCDRRCARWFGVEPYTERLASMMLDAAAPRAPRLVAAARTPNLNVRRLKLLVASNRVMRRCDYLLIALTALVGGAFAAYAVAKPTASTPRAPAVSVDLRADPSRVPIPDTPAGEALAALLSAFNAGDSERLAALLGAFTPQELELDVPTSSQGLELVALVASHPLRIEYITEDRLDRTRRRGKLEIDALDATRIALLEMNEDEAQGGAR